MTTAISSLLNVLVRLWNFMTSNFLLSLGVVSYVLYWFSLVLRKIKKLLI